MSHSLQLTALALILLLSLGALFWRPLKPASHALAAALACAVIWTVVQNGLHSPNIRLTTGAEDRAFPDTS